MRALVLLVTLAIVLAAVVVDAVDIDEQQKIALNARHAKYEHNHEHKDASHHGHHESYPKVTPPPRYVTPPPSSDSAALEVTTWEIPKQLYRDIYSDPTQSKILKDYKVNKFNKPNAAKPSKYGYTAHGGEVLSYITPWHRKGYDYSINYFSTITYFSPVWFNFKASKGDGSTILEITGDHDVNKEWFEEVDKKVLQHNSANPKSKKYIIPRYLMDKWDNTDYPKVFGSQASIDKAVNELLTHCVKNKFGGITIDFGYIGFKHNLREHFLYFFKSLGNHLHAINKILVIVIPPTDAVEYADLVDLGNYVDRYSLMTYDFSTAHTGTYGPIAPLNWIHSMLLKLLDQTQHISYDDSDYDIVSTSEEDGDEYDDDNNNFEITRHSITNKQLASKILMGLNFYGYDYHKNDMQLTNAVITDGFIELLKTNKPKLMWEARAKEHYFNYNNNKDSSQHVVYFPTQKYIQLRLQLAFRFGLGGVAIWEIGQGSPYFFDLL